VNIVDYCKDVFVTVEDLTTFITLKMAILFK